MAVGKDERDRVCEGQKGGCHEEVIVEESKGGRRKSGRERMETSRPSTIPIQPTHTKL
jgi:hypothetical protein